ncbi:unnamed protein product [Trichobilharzia regenti]|nr:unnamed protein product [Trichobilharzia regenti]
MSSEEQTIQIDQSKMNGHNNNNHNNNNGKYKHTTN